MKILVTGASGLVGRAVLAEAQARGHDVLAAGRKGPVHWPPGPVPQSDAVIHLAGASIGGRRWNRRYKQELWDSRIDNTRALVEGMAPATRFVCANAVGYYGREPDGPCHEDSPPGDDFLARLCVAWQEEAQRHDNTVVVRFGHVLAADDGILSRLIPLHKLRLAGIIGGGTQGLPWVHHEDLARLLVDAAQGDWTGIAIGAASNMTYRQLHEALCDRVGGFKPLRVPDAALRVRLGEFAGDLLGGQVVRPRHRHGWEPRFTELGATLDALGIGND